MAPGADDPEPFNEAFVILPGGRKLGARIVRAPWIKRGITVNAISPGFILTPMAQRAIDGDLFPIPYQEIVAGYPVPRVGTPEEAAAVIAFFASEDTGYVTSRILGVNGAAAREGRRPSLPGWALRGRLTGCFPLLTI